MSYAGAWVDTCTCNNVYMYMYGNTLQLFSKNDVDKKVTDIVNTLSNTSKEWDVRISAVSTMYLISQHCQSD